MDKTSASENTQRETKKGLIRKEKRMRNLITQDIRGHAIDQIAGNYDRGPSKTLRYGVGEECELSQLCDDSFAQSPHFVVDCKNKKTDEQSHRRIKS